MPPPGNFMFLTGTGYADNELPLDTGIARGRTSWALLEAWAKGGIAAEVYLVEVDLPGLPLRIGTTDYDTLEGGQQYQALVRSIGNLLHQGPDRSGRLAGRQPTVRFVDSSRQFKRLEQGTTAARIKGSAARIYMTAPAVRPGAWRLEFAGEVATWGYPNDTDVDLVLRTVDRPVKREAPGVLWTLGNEFPNIDGSARGGYAPGLYGEHNSQVWTNKGLVPLAPVDTVKTWRLLCAGWGGVTRLYVNDGLIPVSDYEVLHPLIKGKLYTVAHRLGGLAWAPSDQVTADATGYETQGDGMGDLITNPADQIVHFLTNFVFNQWRTGRWLGVAGLSPMIDPLSYQETRAYCEARGYQGAFRIATPVDGYTALATWALSHGIKVYWTAAGLVGMRVENPNALELYGNPVLRHGSQFQMTYDAEGCTRSVSGGYSFSARDDQALAHIEVTDPTATDADLETAMQDLRMSRVS